MLYQDCSKLNHGHHRPLPIDALLPAAGAMTALFFLLLILLFLI